MPNFDAWMLPEASQPRTAEPNLSEEDEWLDAVEAERKLLARYDTLAMTVKAISFADPGAAKSILTTLSGWAKPHLDRIAELTRQRDQLLRGVGNNGTARPRVEPAPATKAS